MKNNIVKPWIALGYETFAKEGAKHLKIEALSRKIGKNKSSFYHLFTDLNVFNTFLLKYHLEQAQIIAEKENNCKSEAELIEILIEHKIDLLFNRQLRIHRANKEFEACFLKTNQITGNAIKGIWSEILDLKDDSFLAELVFKFSLENFYLQITEESINREWLKGYFNEIKTLVKAMRARTNSTLLDGSV